MLNRALPSFPMPYHVRFHLEQEEEGTWVVRVWAGDRPGMISRQDMDEYDSLTWGEATDVVMSVMDAHGEYA